MLPSIIVLVFNCSNIIGMLSKNELRMLRLQRATHVEVATVRVLRLQ